MKVNKYFKSSSKIEKTNIHTSIHTSQGFHSMAQCGHGLDLL